MAELGNKIYMDFWGNYLICLRFIDLLVICLQWTSTDCLKIGFLVHRDQPVMELSGIC